MYFTCRLFNSRKNPNLLKTSVDLEQKKRLDEELGVSKIVVPVNKYLFTVILWFDQVICLSLSFDLTARFCRKFYVLLFTILLFSFYFTIIGSSKKVQLQLCAASRDQKSIWCIGEGARGFAGAKGKTGNFNHRFETPNAFYLLVFTQAC